VTTFQPATDDLLTFCYHLDLLLGIFRFGNQSLRAVCADDRAVLDTGRLEILEKSMFLGRTSNCRWTDVDGHDLCGAISSGMSAVCSPPSVLRSSALFVEIPVHGNDTLTTQLRKLHLVSLRVLREIISFAPSIVTSNIPIGLTLLKKLYMSIDDSTLHLQTPLMDLLLLIFKRDGSLRSLSQPQTTGTTQGLSRQRSIGGKKTHLKENVEDILGPTSLLLHTILDALSSSRCRSLVSFWSKFFLECLPYFSESIFPILLPTVACVSREICDSLMSLEDMFRPGNSDGENLLDQSITLLTLLEGVLFRAHDVLRADEAKLGNSKGGYDGAGFLNHVMSGVWGGDGFQARSRLANVPLQVNALT
jgi:hypothetical protein